MKKFGFLLLAAATLLVAGTGVHAAQQDVWQKTMDAVARQGFWHNELRVTIIPLTPRVILAEMDTSGKSPEQIAKEFGDELARLKTDRQYVFRVTVERANPDVPSEVPLAGILRSPLLLVKACRVSATTVKSFDYRNLAEQKSDTAIIAFDRKENLLQDYIRPDAPRFTVRLYNPQNAFDIAEWCQADYETPLAYPSEIQSLYDQIKPLVSRVYLISF